MSFIIYTLLGTYRFLKAIDQAEVRWWRRQRCLKAF